MVRVVHDALFTKSRESIDSGDLFQCLSLQVWVAHSAGGALTTDLPIFSLSPQEYITQIGQYIMTLPQYLEPFTESDGDSTTTRRLAINTAVRYSRLPYTKIIGKS